MVNFNSIYIGSGASLVAGGSSVIFNNIFTIEGTLSHTSGTINSGNYISILQSGKYLASGNATSCYVNFIETRGNGIINIKINSKYNNFKLN
jgi:hypothetical protein